MQFTTIYNIGDTIEFMYRARHTNPCTLTALISSISTKAYSADKIDIHYTVFVDMQMISVKENDIISSTTGPKNGVSKHMPEEWYAGENRTSPYPKKDPCLACDYISRCHRLSEQEYCREYKEFNALPLMGIPHLDWHRDTGAFAVKLPNLTLDQSAFKEVNVPSSNARTLASTCDALEELRSKIKSIPDPSSDEVLSVEMLKPIRRGIAVSCPVGCKCWACTHKGI